mmetsp:Transcript_127835/g.220956  ORF Transcript_127835/g.220956 Transcript_127835/m.220956 type:complete len:234 (+) Transcript_127835:408-1109(+)
MSASTRDLGSFRAAGSKSLALRDCTMSRLFKIFFSSSSRLSQTFSYSDHTVPPVISYISYAMWIICSSSVSAMVLWTSTSPALRRYRAGRPAQTSPTGMYWSASTVDPAATTAPLSMRAPNPIVHPLPILTQSPIQQEFRVQLAPMRELSPIKVHPRLGRSGVGGAVDMVQPSNTWDLGPTQIRPRSPFKTQPSYTAAPLETITSPTIIEEGAAQPNGKTIGFLKSKPLNSLR